MTDVYVLVAVRGDDALLSLSVEGGPLARYGAHGPVDHIGAMLRDAVGLLVEARRRVMVGDTSPPAAWLEVAERGQEVDLGRAGLTDECTLLVRLAWDGTTYVAAQAWVRDDSALVPIESTQT